MNNKKALVLLALLYSISLCILAGQLKASAVSSEASSGWVDSFKNMNAQQIFNAIPSKETIMQVIKENPKAAIAFGLGTTVVLATLIRKMQENRKMFNDKSDENSAVNQNFLEFPVSKGITEANLLQFSKDLFNKRSWWSWAIPRSLTRELEGDNITITVHYQESRWRNWIKIVSVQWVYKKVVWLSPRFKGDPPTRWEPFANDPEGVPQGTIEVNAMYSLPTEIYNMLNSKLGEAIHNLIYTSSLV